MTRHPNRSSSPWLVPWLLGRLAIDPRSLAAFRIAIGALLLWDLGARLPDLLALYSDAGAVPRELVRAEHAPWLPYGFFFAAGSPAGTALSLVIFALFALGLALGRFTRLCTVACWLLWCSWMARNPYVVNFGDRILRLALFWAMFLPLGRVASLDARGNGRTAHAPAAPEASLAALAYQLQIVIVYFVGALHKMHPVWTSGQALSYVLEFDQLTRPMGHALTGYPRLMELLTRATLWFEGVLVPLVLSPWRTEVFRGLVVTSAVVFHLGLGVTLFLGHFPAVCIAVWLPFLPAAFWDRVGATLDRSTGPSESDPRRRRDALLRSVVIAALGIVVAVNAATLIGNGRPPEPLGAVARALALDQRWTMFAPAPSRIDGWYVVSGHRPDDTFVDAWEGRGSPRYDKPADPRERYANHRWMSYMVKLFVDRDRSEQSRYLARHLCRRWNAEHPNAPIDHLAIDFMQELTLPGGLEDEPIRVAIVREACSGAGT